MIDSGFNLASNEDFRLWLGRKFESSRLVTIEQVHQHVEGFSWQTFTFVARWCDAQGNVRATGLAVRRQPEDGLLSPYDIRGQYELHRRLAEDGSVPVPGLYWLEMDPGILGMPFYVMECVTGRVPVQWAADDPDIFPSEAARRRLGEQFVDTLAAIHKLPTMGLPVPTATDPWQAPEQAVARWLAEYRRTAKPQLPLVEIAAEWACAHPMPSGRLVLCHGDYRIGNFMVDTGANRISAILDWELAEVSDPVADLAWAALPLFRGRSSLWSQLLPGSEFLARYECVSGLYVTGEQIRYWTIVNLIKVISSYTRATYAFREGRTSDLRLAAMGHQILYVLRMLRSELRELKVLS